jgi:hypothetical protein
MGIIYKGYEVVNFVTRPVSNKDLDQWKLEFQSGETTLGFLDWHKQYKEKLQLLQKEDELKTLKELTELGQLSIHKKRCGTVRNAEGFNFMGANNSLKSIGIHPDEIMLYHKKNSLLSKLIETTSLSNN